MYSLNRNPKEFAIDEIAHSRVHTEQYKQSIYDILSPTKSEEEFQPLEYTVRFTRSMYSLNRNPKDFS